MGDKKTHDAFEAFTKAYYAFKKKNNNTNVVHGNSKNSIKKVNCKVCGTEWVLHALLCSEKDNMIIHCSGCNKLYVVEY